MIFVARELHEEPAAREEPLGAAIAHEGDGIELGTIEEARGDVLDACVRVGAGVPGEKRPDHVRRRRRFRRRGRNP